MGQNIYEAVPALGTAVFSLLGPTLAIYKGTDYMMRDDMYDH